MHELSYLASMVDLAEQTARDNELTHVSYLAIEIGELSGCLPVFFDHYFPVAIDGMELFEGAELRVSTARGEGLCLDCSSIYNVLSCEGVCPTCGSRRKRVLGGQDVTLLEIGGE